MHPRAGQPAPRMHASSSAASGAGGLAYAAKMLSKANGQAGTHGISHASGTPFSCALPNNTALPAHYMAAHMRSVEGASSVAATLPAAEPTLHVSASRASTSVNCG